MIQRVQGDRKRYMSLLLLADEQPEMVARYIDRGHMWVFTPEDAPEGVVPVVAECLVTDEGEGVLEIKSLAVEPAYQGRGYGRALIEHVAATYAGRYRTLQVGTGDSPLTVPFYERCGFSRSHVVPNFFTDNYDHSIYEAGVRLVDMVYMRRQL
ncbi:GNAT family N-acetyltransferase [Collinsella sp. An307]|nr:GNAT family N-acetyltransferase [Collinsella sp. An307]